MIDQTHGNTNQHDKEGEKIMTQEIQELLKQIDDYKQLAEDTENALDAAIENLEEALAEAYEEEQNQ